MQAGLLLLLSHFTCVRLCATHRWKPTRHPCPWDSPGKNTGVGCHFLLQRVKVKSEKEVTQSCPTLSDPMDCSLPRLRHPWDFPGKSTGVGCHRLLRHAGLKEAKRLAFLGSLRIMPITHCSASRHSHCARCQSHASSSFNLHNTIT